MNIASQPADNTEYAIHTSPPAAGGAVTINFDLWSKIASSYHSVASMTSDSTPGVTQVSQAVTVTP